MSNKILLERIEKRIKITKEKKSSVILSLSDWEAIEDMIMELSSPKLLESIKKPVRIIKKAKE